MSTGRYAGKNKKFTIIGHSLGCLTAKLIEKDLKHGTLQNIVCVGGTLENSPMRLNQGLDNIINEVENRTYDEGEALNILIQTGAKDLMIPT